MSAGLTETRSSSSKNWVLKYLSFATDVFTKCSWVKPLKDENVKTVFHGFIETVADSKRKPNKWWADQGRNFYKYPMQKWLEDNDILMCSTHNEGKSVVALMAKIYKKMTPKDKKSYPDYLDKLVLSSLYW